MGLIPSHYKTNHIEPSKEQAPAGKEADQAQQLREKSPTLPTQPGGPAPLIHFGGMHFNSFEL